jgi:hypothetical protein
MLACMHACMHARAQQLQALAALKQAISNEPLAQEPHASSIRGTSPVNWTLLERSTAAAKGESFFFFSLYKKKTPVDWTLLERSTPAAEGELSSLLYATTYISYQYVLLHATYCCMLLCTCRSTGGTRIERATVAAKGERFYYTLYYYLFVRILLILHYCFTGKSPVKWANHRARHRSGRRRAFSSSLLDTTICDILYAYHTAIYMSAY